MFMGKKMNKTFSSNRMKFLGVPLTNWRDPKEELPDPKVEAHGLRSDPSSDLRPDSANRVKRAKKLYAKLKKNKVWDDDRSVWYPGRMIVIYDTGSKLVFETNLYTSDQLWGALAEFFFGDPDLARTRYSLLKTMFWNDKKQLWNRGITSEELKNVRFVDVDSEKWKKFPDLREDYSLEDQFVGVLCEYYLGDRDLAERFYRRVLKLWGKNYSKDDAQYLLLNSLVRSVIYDFDQSKKGYKRLRSKLFYEPTSLWLHGLRSPDDVYYLPDQLLGVLLEGHFSDDRSTKDIDMYRYLKKVFTDNDDKWYYRIELWFDGFRVVRGTLQTYIKFLELFVIAVVFEGLELKSR